MVHTVPFKYQEYPHEEAEDIKHKLNKKLEYHEIKQRPAANGIKVAYIEGWKAYSLANEVFGFNGWSSTILNMQTDFEEEKDSKISVGISCTVRICLKDGTFHDDIGYGSSENQKSKAAAYSKAKKEAVTDATKRSLRCFGSRLGNCMYDKDFLRELQRSNHDSNIKQKTCLQNMGQHKATLDKKMTLAGNSTNDHHSVSSNIHDTFVPGSEPPTLIFAEDDYVYEDLDEVLLQAITTSEMKQECVAQKPEEQPLVNGIPSKRKLWDCHEFEDTKREIGNTIENRTVDSDNNTMASSFRPLSSGTVRHHHIKDPLNLRYQNCER